VNAEAPFDLIARHNVGALPSMDQGHDAASAKSGSQRPSLRL
jgi:hypothetical protein